MASKLIAKVRKALHRGGVLGTLKQAVARLYVKIRDQSPARRRARRLKEQADRDFDREFHVETAGFVPLDRLHFGSGSKDDGFAYDPIEPEKFNRTVGSVALRHEDYVFIDFGSGKGKALLLASELPFRKVIGVEFAPELHRIAEQNVRTFQSPRQRCQEIELACADAATYPLPPVPAVLFFFNPFGGEVMARVIANIRKSYTEHPRELVVVYVTPVMEELWDRADFVVKVSSQKGYCAVYRTR